MQACGPVVRPHEILQTLIISIPQPSAAVKSFFELSRNFGAPFSLYPQQRVYLRRYSGAPLEATLRPRRACTFAAFGGRGCRCPPTGVRRAHGGGQKGTGHRMVSCPLLTPLTFLWTRLPSVARLKARGPQGRSLLQEYTFDRSGACRSDGVSALHRMAAHCYARQITQSKFRA